VDGARAGGDEAAEAVALPDFTERPPRDAGAVGRLRRFAGSLFGRTLLALLAVGLLPVAIASFRLVDLNREAMAEQVLRTHVVAARTSAARVSAFVDARRALALGAASNPALAEPRAPGAASFLAENVRAWAGLGVLAVAVRTPAGEEVVRAQLTEPGVGATVSLVLEASSGGPTSAVQVGERALLRLSAPLARAAGEVVVVADGAELASALESDEIGEQAELVLLDANGVRVAGSTLAPGALPGALLDTARSGRVASASRFRRDDGHDVLGASAPVEGTPWAVVSLQPLRVADALAESVRRRAMTAVGAALLLIAAISAIAWTSVVRPVARLAAAQNRLAGRAGEGGAGSIGELEASFAALERALADRGSVDAVSLGRYRVLEVLGSGGMGTVFRGFDPKLERPVALKIVRTKLAAAGQPPSDTRRTERLLREAVTSARFNHPHIVAVYDVEDTPQGAFVAMEFVDGASLEALIDTQGVLAPSDAAALGAAVAEALATAHGREVLHRDVKPANVLLGKDGAIKVTDFGIAALVSGQSEDRDRIFGTPGFLAPEVLLDGAWGPAADLFALGVTLHYALTGELPYPGATPRDLLRATLEGPNARPAGRGAEATELERLVLRLVAREAAARPPSAQAVAEELAGLCQARSWSWRSRPVGAVPHATRRAPSGQWLATQENRRVR